MIYIYQLIIISKISIRHMKGPKLGRRIHPTFAISIDMSDSPALHKLGQHLSDIQIAFVLAFDKVKVTQREIASLVKCSRKAASRTPSPITPSRPSKDASLVEIT